MSRSRIDRFGSIAFRILEQTIDPAEPTRYQDSNFVLKSESPGSSQRIVCIGDSLLEGWRDLESLAPTGVRLINRGASGQTATQILLRFQDDVVALAPVAVFILAGANDIRLLLNNRNTERSAVDRVRRAVMTMTDAADGRGITVGIGLLPPLRSTGRSPSAVRAVNAELNHLANERRLPIADFYSPMTDSQGRPLTHLTRDGVHPNTAGYLVMAKVLQPLLMRLAARPRP